MPVSAPDLQRISCDLEALSLGLYAASTFLLHRLVCFFSHFSWRGLSKAAIPHDSSANANLYSDYVILSFDSVNQSLTSTCALDYCQHDAPLSYLSLRKLHRAYDLIHGAHPAFFAPSSLEPNQKHGGCLSMVRRRVALQSL